MSRPQHYESDVSALELRLTNLAKGEPSNDRTRQMLEVQELIRQREERCGTTRTSEGADSEAEIAQQNGEAFTPAEVHQDQPVETVDSRARELLTIFNVGLMTIIEARHPRREAICLAFAFGLDIRDYPSMRAAAEGQKCSVEEISGRVGDIQRAHGLPANRYNKSLRAKEAYKNNGRR